MLTLTLAVLLVNFAYAGKPKTKADHNIKVYAKIYLDDRPAESGKVQVFNKNVEVAKQSIEKGRIGLSLAPYKDYFLKFKVKNREFSIKILASTMPTRIVGDYIQPVEPELRVYSDAYIKKKGAYKKPYFDARSYEIPMKIIRSTKSGWEEDADHARDWYSETLLQKVKNAEADLREKLAALQAKADELAAWQQSRIELGEKYAQLQKISGAIYYGEFLESPLSSAEVELRDAKGEVIETVCTTELGTFVFSKVEKGKAFSIAMSNGKSVPANVRIAITDENREIIQESTTNSSGGFDFNFLPSDRHALELMEIEDTEIVMDFDGKIFEGAPADSKPADHLKVELLNKAGNVVGTSVTEDNGAFHFDHLPAEDDYSIHIGASEAAKVTSGKITITTDDEQLIASLEKGADGGFNYDLLPADKFELGTMVAEDPWLDIMAFEDLENEVTVREQIHFASGKSEVSPEDLIVLNKVVRVLVANDKLKMELTTHSDARGGDDANLKLSEERAASALAIITEKGIDPSRITAAGKGESQLINKCGNDVDCSEEEHAQNRRAEFRVYQ